MKIIRTSAINAVSVTFRLIALFGINKVIATYVGPSGFSTIGQFQNAMQLITGLINGTISNSVIKLTAEHENNSNQQLNLWKTVGTLTLIIITPLTLLIYLSSKYLSETFFSSPEYTNVIKWFSLNLILFSFNAVLMAIMNGKKDISRHALSSIIGSIVSLTTAAGLTAVYGLDGALLALATYQSVVFFSTLSLIRRTSYFKIKYLFGKVDPKIAKSLKNFLYLALVSAIVMPGSQIFVRTHLINIFGFQTTGIWDALWRLSSVNIIFFTSIISFYLLPKATELNSPNKIKSELLKTTLFIVPLFTISCLVIIWNQKLIIEILFTEEFYQIGPLLKLQFVGDGIKLFSWIIGYIMMGRGIILGLIISEAVAGLSFVGFTYLLTSSFGINGVALAHTLTYLTYLLFLCIFFWTHLLKSNLKMNNSE